MINEAVLRDRIRGSLYGGAAGDALGYAVEFYHEDQIKEIYGSDGITEYKIDKKSGKALISDDTQMTLFTANGILVGNTRVTMCGIGKLPRVYMGAAYQDWLRTQKMSFEEAKELPRRSEDDEDLEGGIASWLMDIPELFSRRAPGMTCLSALEEGERKSLDFIVKPVNDSKGCGGVMRMAPLALTYVPDKNFFGPIINLDKEGAQLAAMTHGHSLGYMPAATLTHILSRILTDLDHMSVKDIITEAKDTTKVIFENDPYIDDLIAIIDLAISLSENDDDDLTNIHRLGEGWVAEEALAIAIYCVLRYQDDFSKGIIAAANHNGDSDSTAAITGNILGAIVGFEAIAEKWKTDLELADVILEMADDMMQGCIIDEFSTDKDPVWMTKYVNMHRYVR